MPLSPAASREHIHSRDISCRGYRREDGLWDIEGRMVDTKTYGFDNRYRGRVEPGVPVHEMWIRLTVDDALEVRAVEAVTDHHPFPDCPDIAPDYSALAGTRIRPGWSGVVRERMGGVAGCTHLTRLLQELAVVAIQTVYPLVKGRAPAPGETPRRPPHLDSCHALASDGPVVKELYPQWYRS